MHPYPMKRCLLIVLFLQLSLISLAGVAKPDSLATVIGVVQQEHKNMEVFVPLNGCVIQVFFEKEGKLDSLYTTSAAPNGRFTFKNLLPQRILMRLQCLGYETQSGVYEIEPGENAFSFTMKEAAEELSAAYATAEMQLMKQIKDTTVFNTQAIRSLPGDDLRDVIAQLPGFSLTSSGISVDGVKVAKTYVNGILIFGDDAINAVNALKADEVTQIKVYDEQSAVDKRRGKVNSKKERVLDVITRQNFISLSKATATVAGGLNSNIQGNYGIGAGVDYDSEMLNIKASAVASNYSNYDSHVSGTNGTAEYFHTSEKPLTSDKREERLNVFLEKHWKSRAYGNSLLLNYDFSHGHNSKDIVIITDYFGNETQAPQTSEDSTKSVSSTYNHKFRIYGLFLETRIKSINIDMTADVTHGSAGTYYHDTWKNNDLITKERNESNRDEHLKYNISGSLGWTNNDAGRWRPRASIWGKLSKDRADSWTVDTLSTSFLKRQLTGNGNGNNIHSGMLVGVSSIVLNDRTRTMDIDIYGTVSYSHTKNKKITLDEWQVDIPVMDISNSYEYTYNDILSKVVVAASYSNSKKMNISAEVSINDKLLLNNETIPIIFNNRKNFVFPSYTFSFDSPKFNITSSSQEITPSIEQIRNRVSDSNPMVLTAGNPDLKQAQRFNFGVQYKPGVIIRNNTTHSIRCALNGNITASPLVNRSLIFSEDTKLDQYDGYIAKEGAMLYTWENSRRPSWNMGISTQYDTRIIRNRVGTKLNLAFSYAQDPMFLKNDLLWMGGWHVSSGITLTYKPSRKIDISSNTRVGYQRSVNNNQTTLAARMEINERFNFRWMILPRLRWETTYLLSAFKSLQGEGRNNFEHVLNTRLTTALLKDNSLELSLSGNDLINSPNTYSTQTNALYMTQTWQKTYGRYLILSVTYNFRKKK